DPADDHGLRLHDDQFAPRVAIAVGPRPARWAASRGDPFHAGRDREGLAATVLRVALAHREHQQRIRERPVVLDGAQLDAGLERPEVELSEMAGLEPVAASQPVGVLDDENAWRDALGV